MRIKVSIAILLGSACFLLTFAVFGYFLVRKFQAAAGPKLTAPITSQEFPSSEIDYPTDWPEELRLPNEFILVDYAAGTLPSSSVQGWSQKNRIDGSPGEAIKQINSFLSDQGWRILEKYQDDTGGYTLLIESNDGSGVIVITPDEMDNSQTLVLITAFP